MNNNKTTLPTFSIEGVGNTIEEKLQSLVEIEPILVMAGYSEPDESWNNCWCEYFSHQKHVYMALYSNNKILYLNHKGSNYYRSFKASQLRQMLNYIYSYAYEHQPQNV